MIPGYYVPGDRNARLTSCRGDRVQILPFHTVTYTRIIVSSVSFPVDMIMDRGDGQMTRAFENIIFLEYGNEN